MKTSVWVTACVISTVASASGRADGQDAPGPAPFASEQDRTRAEAAVGEASQFRGHRVEILRRSASAVAGADDANGGWTAIVFDYSMGKAARVELSGDLAEVRSVESLTGVPQASPAEIARGEEIIRSSPSFASRIKGGADVAGGFVPAAQPEHAAGEVRPRLLEFRVSEPGDPQPRSERVLVNLTARRIEESGPCCGAAAGADQSCLPPHHIVWPDVDPVWSLCWVAPSDSSGGDGSGLELTDVAYKGRTVLKRAHVPVLNVKYDGNACGPYRDWLSEMVPFEADNVLSLGYAEPTSPPGLVCDHPGQDAGSFTGVAAEKLNDRLVLTTQTRAGWYRYGQKWIFHRDGTIETRFLFSHVRNACIFRPRCHHAYYRFDFDIGDPGDDVVERRGPAGWARLPEVSERRGGASWRVKDRSADVGYEIVSGAGDDDDTNATYSVSDMWALKYQPGELDDGGSTDTRARMNRFVNGDPIDGADVVVWYRAGAAATGGLSCEVRGPTLRPFGW